MSLIIKIMSDEKLPDTDLTKGFRLVLAPDGTSINFVRDHADQAIIVVTSPATREREFMTETYPQPGNAYVINEQGKTIAIRNNKSEIVPIPKNEKEALKFGRGGKRAVPGTDPKLAVLQNMAASSYHSEYSQSARKPENELEATIFGRLGQVAPKGTLETLALIQNQTAMEALNISARHVASDAPRTYPNANVPNPTASLAIGPKDNTQRGIRKD